MKPEVIYSRKEAWLLTGSQHLYGDEVLKEVRNNAIEVATGLDSSDFVPVRIVFKDVLTNPDSICKIIQEANKDLNCIAVIAWMHTFSPAKMWIAGLKILQKPILHLHTQFNRDIPWDKIDMNFMNLNQSAHGGREFGFIGARMRLERKIIAGHWENGKIQKELGRWLRVALAWNDWQGMKVARFGDNMRDVAVTEGDKVAAQVQLGYSVNGYGLGDLADIIDGLPDDRIEAMLKQYLDQYQVPKKLIQNQDKKLRLWEAAAIEIGMRDFLEEGGFSAFTTNFENLHGLPQLPGLAVQRLMADGYGFGAEGDWKTAALVRAMKVMSEGLPGGTSFMEDYTYHFHPDKMQVLGAHMLEICPSIGLGKPLLEIYPLGIGGKMDPARLIFNVGEGGGINVSLIDLGNRFRMVINPCEVLEPRENLPNLPVARVLWDPKPSLETAATAWIIAGGAHHTSFSMALDAPMLRDFGEIAGLEVVVIDEDTTVGRLKEQLRWNEVYYQHYSPF